MRPAQLASLLSEANPIDEWLASMGLTRADVEQLVKDKGISSEWKVLQVFSDDHTPCVTFRAPDNAVYEMWWTSNQFIGALENPTGVRGRKIIRYLSRVLPLFKNPPPELLKQAQEHGEAEQDVDANTNVQVSLEDGKATVVVNCPYGSFQSTNLQHSEPPMPE